MTWTRRAVASASATSTAVSVTKPTDLAAGDVMVAIIHIDNNSASPDGPPTLSAEPSGWTAAPANPYDDIDPGQSYGQRTYFYRKIATAGDVSAWSFTATLDVTRAHASAVYAASTDGASGAEFDQEIAVEDITSDTAMTVGELSSVPADSISIIAIGYYASYMTSTAPTGWTEANEMGVQPNVTMAEDLTASGTMTPGSATCSHDTRSNSYHVTYNDVAGGGGGRIMGSIAGVGGLAGPGGIAGKGGGLAG